MREGISSGGISDVWDLGCGLPLSCSLEQLHLPMHSELWAFCVLSLMNLLRQGLGLPTLNAGKIWLAQEQAHLPCRPSCSWLLEKSTATPQAGLCLWSGDVCSSLFLRNQSLKTTGPDTLPQAGWLPVKNCSLRYPFLASAFNSFSPLNFFSELQNINSLTQKKTDITFESDKNNK